MSVTAAEHRIDALDLDRLGPASRRNSPGESGAAPMRVEGCSFAARPGVVVPPVFHT
jgi:hypothetical protein